MRDYTCKDNSAVQSLQTPLKSDRFIMTRTLYRDLATSFNTKSELLSNASPHEGCPCKDCSCECNRDDSHKLYTALLQSQVLGVDNPQFSDPDDSPTAPGNKYSVLKLSQQPSAPKPARKGVSLSPLCGFDPDELNLPFKSERKISKVPFKVLDAPALQDDFYLNLVDWSAQNVLSVGLGSCIYLWSASSSKVTKLYDLGGSDTVTSVQWSTRGQQLAVGTNLGKLQIWDAEKCKLVKTMGGHESRIGTVAWNSRVLSSGSRDKTILHRDFRSSKDFECRLSGHKQEVCGLKWSSDEQQLASGGNDNKLLLWSIQNSQSPVGRFSNHVAAVKAIAWSPHQHGLLASGGGTADRCIRFWNTLTMEQVACTETGSQVCNLLFSKNVNELVSTHGYSQNQVVLWKYPSMKKIVSLTGHTFRVLYLAVSPDG